MSASLYLNTPPAERGYWLTTEVAAALCCSRPTATKLIDSGRLAGHRLPGSRRRVVMHADLMAFLRADPQYHRLIGRAETMSRAAALGVAPPAKGPQTPQTAKAAG